MNKIRLVMLSALVLGIGYLVISGQLAWYLGLVLIAGTAGLIYWSLVRSTEMPDLYAGSEWIKTKGKGITVLMPEWLMCHPTPDEQSTIASDVLNDIDSAFTDIMEILSDEYGEPSVDPERLSVIIMKCVNAFAQPNSPTGFASGDTACGKNISIRICLRPEKGEKNTEILNSRGGYLAPLGWELKNAYNCVHNVGKPDFTPPVEVREKTNLVMVGLKFKHEDVHGMMYYEI